MIVYWLLLLPTAFIAYFLGSMDTLVLASNFVFHRNLLRLGKGNTWLSNFKRIYGIKGFLKLLAVEAVRDAIPIIVGGLLLGIKGHPEAGRAVAGFCLVMGRLFPMLYDLKGSHAALPMVAAALAVDTSAGIAAAVVLGITLLASRYLSVSAVAAALTYAVVAVLVVDDSLILKLAIFTAAAVIVKHIPSILRLARGEEEKLTGEEDITYKLDEKFK